MVLHAIRETRVEMGVYVAVYVDANEQAYQDQLKAIRDALQVYGTGNVLGVSTRGADVARDGALIYDSIRWR